MLPAPVVVACGLATLDVTQTVDRLPGPDEKVVARDLAVAAGGPALNAAVTAARLGCTATLVTRVGHGAPAAAVRAELAPEGVVLDDRADDAWRLAVSTVLVTRATGQRAVVSTNAAGHAPTARASVTLPDGAACLLVDGHHLDLALAAARAARAAGVPVLLDGGSWKPGLADLLALVDVAVCSADLRVPGHEQGPLDDAGVAALLEAVAAHGPAVVARSSGSGPVDVLVREADADARGRVDVERLGPDDVVDTLGAGDVLHGAALAALAHLGPGPLRLADVLDVLRVATRVATASVRHPGARGWTADASLVAALRDEIADVRRG